MHFQIKDIFKRFTADTVGNEVISAAIDINKEQFKLFSQLVNAGVRSNEGTTRGIHDLGFVLENLLSGFQPFPCFTSVIKKRTTPDYTEYLSRGIEFLPVIVFLLAQSKLMELEHTFT